MGGYDMDAEGKRNPTWTRDELILTLDFYVQCQGNPPAKDAKPIKEPLLKTEWVSRLLKNQLRSRNLVA